MKWQSITLTFVLIISGAHCISESRSEPVSEIQLHRPAEFDPQKEIWIAWPLIEHKQGFSQEEVILEMIDHIASTQKVVLLVPDDHWKSIAEEELQSISHVLDSLQIVTLDYEEHWVRDMGPVFAFDHSGNEIVIDFEFNVWGYDEAGYEPDASVDRRAAEYLSLPTYIPGIIAEGGNHELDGRGTLILTEAVELDRNPHLTLPELEEIYRKTYGVEQIIWIENGLYEDEQTFRGPLPLGNGEVGYTVITTGGHIDTFVRFANDSTIMLAWQDPYEILHPIQEENYQRLSNAYERLQGATDLNGRPFHIIKVPTAPVIVETMEPGDYVYDFISELEYEGDHQFPKGEEINVLAAASYLNFLITNDLVLVSAFGGEGKPNEWTELDRQVEEQFIEAFPDKEIVMIYSMAVNLGGGGMHCITNYRSR